MSSFSLLAVALALAMDAFAVAIVTGMTLKVISGRHLFRLAFHFGLFQSVMFAMGWFVGKGVQNLVAAFDHWIAFALLLLVGVNIIRGAFKREEEPRALDPTAGWQLVFLSFATSVDALAVGLSLAMIGASIAFPALVIGLMAAVLTLLGMAMGRRLGACFGRSIEVFGGVILIAIGIRIVWLHTMV